MNSFFKKMLRVDWIRRATYAVQLLANSQNSHSCPRFLSSFAVSDGVLQMVCVDNSTSKNFLTVDEDDLS